MAVIGVTGVFRKMNPSDPLAGYGQRVWEISFF